MEERELVAIIEGELATSIGGGGGSGSGVGSDLASERAMELDYYNSQPLGNEREGESQVVSSDVFDAVESMLPHLLKTFTASDDAVEFEPVGLEDEEAAKQRTDVCNYVFYKQNNGFLLAYEWFKDALLQKNGVVKYWWEEKTDITEEEYQGMTEGEYLTLMKDDDIEVLEHSAYDDPAAIEQKKEMLQKLQAMPRIGPPQMPMQAAVQQAIPAQPDPSQLVAQLNAAPVPQLHDIKVKLTKDASQICIEAVPPEEFGISAKHKCISIQDTPFCYHRTKKTISYLREMGCPEDIINQIGGEDGGMDTTPESIARNRFTDEYVQGNEDQTDDSLKEVWVTDCFIRLDFDDDGKAELRHIIMAERTIWINESANHINFAAITPIIMPHRWIGKSIAEITMDFQFINSVLLRQMLNNLYLTNNPQKVVLGSQGGVLMADIDRLMTSRVGGILVEYAPNAIRGLEVPFVAGAAFPMLEYLEGKKEQRTGNTRYNQGTDADSLNKTARGISMIQSASQQKIDLIARIFAETGFKDLFRGIAYFLSKYSTKAMTLKLRNKWVDVDPREWKSQFNMTVNVGLGTGNKDAQLVHLSKMNEVQLELIKEGRGYMVTDQNVYNLAKKMAENMGFKHPDIFISAPASAANPDGVKRPPAQPDPDLIKIQQADAEVKLKIQSNERIRQFDAQTQKEVETIKAEALKVVEQMRIASHETIEKMKLQHAEQLAIFNANATPKPQDDSALKLTLADNDATLKWETAKLNAATTIEVAQIGSKTALTQTAVKAQTEADKQVSADLGNGANGTAKPDDKLHSAIAALVVAQEKNAQSAKAPRKHKFMKTPDGGWEATSTIQ